MPPGRAAPQAAAGETQVCSWTMIMMMVRRRKRRRWRRRTETMRRRRRTDGDPNIPKMRISRRRKILHGPFSIEMLQ